MVFDVFSKSSTSLTWSAGSTGFASSSGLISSIGSTSPLLSNISSFHACVSNLKIYKISPTWNALRSCFKKRMKKKVLIRYGLT